MNQPTKSAGDANPVFKWVAGGIHRLFKYQDFLISAECLTDPERLRQARLISGFGILGTFFGAAYAMFYLLIGHLWGALIIIICSSGFAATSFLIRRSKSMELAGNILILTQVFGFSALCFVEGGLQGHAIAWLVSVPLCALLLLGQRAATRWALVAFLAAAVVAAFDLMEVKLPVTYDLKWNSIVSTCGYLGLIIFMFILGLLFETNRKRAFLKMQQAHLELAGANERLVHLNNEKNEFLEIAAHDLRNPLTVILGNAELAGLLQDANKTPKYLDNISNAATRMSTLINDLLDVNAIEQGKFTSTAEPCLLGELVEKGVQNNETSAAKKSIQIRVGTSAELWASACPAAVLQILDNLISNALKFSPPNSTVHVHTLPETNHVLVVVRDEGPGISEADQKKLFQKFTRLTARPTGGESSSGLGLAIVKRLAEAMSGSIQCYSTLGAGTTFTLRLPVCLPPASGKAIDIVDGTKTTGRAIIPQKLSQYLDRN